MKLGVSIPKNLITTVLYSQQRRERLPLLATRTFVLLLRKHTLKSNSGRFRVF